MFTSLNLRARTAVVRVEAEVDMTSGQRSSEETVSKPTRHDAVMMWGFIVASLLLTLASVVTS